LKPIQKRRLKFLELILEDGNRNLIDLAMKTVSILFGILFCIFFIPIMFGVIGGIFGIVAGIFGGIIGIIASIIGGIAGAIGGLFGWIFGGDFWHYGFFHWNGFTIAALVVLIVIIAKSKRR
jgi:hypothetical protein